MACFLSGRDFTRAETPPLRERVCWIPDSSYKPYCGETVNKTLLCALTFCLLPAAFAASVITTRPDDPKAIYLDAPAANADSSAQLQSAIDKAAGAGREGIVFVPAGRYTLTRTIYVWPGVRLIGYGATRPVFVLPPNTPGFQKGMGVMVMFTGLGPNAHPSAGSPIPFPPPGTVPPNNNIADANQGTFYSAMSNIDFEIGDGNPAAVAVRFHVAQHAFLTHMDFHIGSGLAALYQVGNEAEDVHFYGGRYGILTEQTSPGWQFTLIDSTFEGQREAAIREHEAGLTLIRDSFRNVPTAIDIDPGYSDELWVKDSRFENIAGPTVIISLEHNPLTEIGFENAILQNAPILARLRESGKTIAGKGAIYRGQGLQLRTHRSRRRPHGHDRHEVRRCAAHLDARDVAACDPRPAAHERLGQRALARRQGRRRHRRHRCHPTGDRRASACSTSQAVITWCATRSRSSPDTVLIGLHPTLTQIDLLDETPGYQGVGAPKPVILAPPGGANILSGIGMFAGGIDPRAVAVLWKAGEQSLIDDVRFPRRRRQRFQPLEQQPHRRPRSAQALGRPVSQPLDRRRRWRHVRRYLDPEHFCASGICRLEYQNARPRVRALERAPLAQRDPSSTTSRTGTSTLRRPKKKPARVPSPSRFEIDNSRNLTFANYHAYRVTRSRAPFPAAVRIYNSSDIHFRNVHVNAESGYPICDNNGCGTFLRISKFPYENSIEDMTHHFEVREREFAVLDIPANPLPSRRC